MNYLIPVDQALHPSEFKVQPLLQEVNYLMLDNTPEYFLGESCTYQAPMDVELGPPRTLPARDLMIPALPSKVVLEVLPLSIPLPVMASAMLCVWATHSSPSPPDQSRWRIILFLLRRLLALSRRPFINFLGPLHGHGGHPRLLCHGYGGRPQTFCALCHGHRGRS